jgi:DNA-binding NarL/FixJ family response regulator
MRSLSVVVLQSDSMVAQSLLNSLSSCFRSVRSARSLGDLRASIARTRAEVVVVDMETASLKEIADLSREFPKARIVCTHRLADEAMWAAALGAGAADVCPSSDTHGILTAALSSLTRTRPAAA